MSNDSNASRPPRQPQGPGLSFDAEREATLPTPAATVIVVREAEEASDGSSASSGIEVFCVRRHAQSGFMGGALVFPGGKLDKDDADPSWALLANDVDARALGFATDPAEARALAVAAARELVEEAGILPLVTSPGAPVAAPELIGSIRTRLGTRKNKGEPLKKLVAEHGLRLDLAALVPFARWVTPTAESRRFDARFYLLSLPSGQTGRHDDEETTDSFWASPSEVLARFERAEVWLAPPTTRTLEPLAQVQSMSEAVALATQQGLQPICPRFVPGDPPVLSLPGDPTHEIPEPRVDGPTRFVLRDGRFVSEGP